MAKFQQYEAKTITRLNVRNKPNKDGEVVRVLEVGEKIKVLSKNGDFGRIGTKEYVMLEFIERI